MRRPRLKLDSSKECAYYHCISRVVGAARLFGNEEKEVLQKQMWLLAEYCGLQIVTYALMTNHYHILVKVPLRSAVSDAELLRRYRLLYPSLKPIQAAHLAAVESDMVRNGELAQAWRRRQQLLMFDVSQFNKLLKMRFSLWFNKRHKRVGTLWSERFKSVLVENGAALEAMAAYIDLNCVRARIVRDPCKYRFCGYAEAVAGKTRAQHGLTMVYNCDWSETKLRYGGLLYGHLSREPGVAGGVCTEKSSFTKSLQCSFKFCVQGVVIGSEAYVREKIMQLAEACPNIAGGIRDVPFWGDLCTLGRAKVAA